MSNTTTKPETAAAPTATKPAAAAPVKAPAKPTKGAFIVSRTIMENIAVCRKTGALICDVFTDEVLEALQASISGSTAKPGEDEVGVILPTALADALLSDVNRKKSMTDEHNKALVKLVDAALAPAPAPTSTAKK